MPPPSFSSVSGGVQLISVGILGEYLGRIYDEVKSRPLYVLKEKGL
jgi:dolichol-phosphate mannosyltransferase